MKPYILLKTAEKEYRLKYTNAIIAELEDDLNSSYADGLEKLTEVRVLAKYLKAALVTLNDGITAEETYNIMDEFALAGGNTDDLRNIVMETMVNSGFIREEAYEISKKLQAQMQEKANALLSR